MSYRNAKDIDNQIELSVNDKMGAALKKNINAKFIEEQKNLIIARTQLGIGVDPMGEAYKLPPLSENYKEQRQGKARWYTTKDGRRVKVTKDMDYSGTFVKKPRLASTTTPSKSNLTATGQLLKSLTTVKMKMSGGIKWIIKLGDNRGRDLFGYSSKIGNKELNSILESKGRRFLGFTRAQRNEIVRKIRQIIRRSLK